MRPLPLVTVLATAFLTTACGFRLTIQGPDGSNGTGRGSAGLGQGSVRIAIGGRRYEGIWVSLNGRPPTFGAILRTGRLATESGLSPAEVASLAKLRAADGDVLNCEMAQNRYDATGWGACRSSSGVVYDVTWGSSRP